MVGQLVGRQALEPLQRALDRAAEARRTVVGWQQQARRDARLVASVTSSLTAAMKAMLEALLGQAVPPALLAIMEQVRGRGHAPLAD